MTVPFDAGTIQGDIGVISYLTGSVWGDLPLSALPLQAVRSSQPMLSVSNCPRRIVHSPIASMLQPSQILSVAGRVGLLTMSVLLTFVPTAALAQDHSSDHETSAPMAAERLPAETVIMADVHVPQLATNSIIGAALCFAVGFGACLLVVHYLLPSLVHAQCVAIVREHLDYASRESDIRVVVLDREHHDSLQRPRRVAAPASEEIAAFSYESPHHLRVDKPQTSASRSHTMPTHASNENAATSMLSQIYEQNLHLRDQLRQQSRSVKQ